MTGPAMSEPPPVPDGGINFYFEAACTDNETGQKGYCYVGYDKGGTTYMTFWQQGQLMMIRKILSRTEYETVWTAVTYGSV